MKNGPPFHLTVDAYGLVSLWDTAESAQAQTDQGCVEVEADADLLDKLQRAQEDAIRRTKKAPWPGTDG